VLGIDDELLFGGGRILQILVFLAHGDHQSLQAEHGLREILFLGLEIFTQALEIGGEDFDAHIALILVLDFGGLFQALFEFLNSSERILGFLLKPSKGSVGVACQLGNQVIRGRDADGGSGGCGLLCHTLFVILWLMVVAAGCARDAAPLIPGWEDAATGTSGKRAGGTTTMDGFCWTDGIMRRGAGVVERILAGG